ncbi:hypothetical protein [Actinoplanes sp. NPDC026619]|uniref:hypothetical protein n=1 Tax=Actinoplanes sp. NPDC026619 TaxID=3155798 RepID=UPI0033FE27D1
MSLFTRLADRIHAHGDDAARAAGLTVQRLPGGRRRIGHPDMPALLEARRVRVITEGLDEADRAMSFDPGTRAALDATRARLAAARPLSRAA